MHNTNDNILINYRPDSLQEDNYIADIEAIIENGAYHSDEVSETDDEKTQDEVSRHIRPKNKNESDHHVIRVYDKPWRIKSNQIKSESNLNRIRIFEYFAEY